MSRFVHALVVLLALWAGAGVMRADESSINVKKDSIPTVDFQKEIQPLLQMKCCRCHGPTNQKADLDLSSQIKVYFTKRSTVARCHRLQRIG